MAFDLSNLGTKNTNQNNFDINDYVDMNKVNTILQSASSYIKCDAECEKKTKLNTLKKKYTDLQKKNTTYETELNEARRAYYKAAFNDVNFRDEAEKDIAESAKKEAIIIRNEIIKSLANLETAFSNMEEKNINIQLTKELIKKIERENESMISKMNEHEKQTNINQRMSLYEYKNVKTVDFFNSIFDYLLISAFIIYLGLFIYYKLGYSTFNIFILVLVALIVFFVYFVSFFKMIYNKIF